MAERIPDLWRMKEDAARLYQLCLCRLQMHDQHERVVSACRQIRRHAARGPGPAEGWFTFYFAIDSLCELGNYRAAWRQLRLREELAFGERFDLVRREWTPTDWWDLAFYYAPLLFFLGRYRRGCALLETSLGFCFGGKKTRSFDLLFHVSSGDTEPRHRCGVALSHFYTRLGKSLGEWRHWEAFVKGFHPRLFRLAAIRRDELLRDPGRLGAFAAALMTARDDLLESPRKRQRDKFVERNNTARKRIEAKLHELFPELRGLPR
jgi:hypothetical protein